MPHDAIMKMRMDLERKSNAEDRDSKFGPVDPSVPSIPRPWIQIPTEHCIYSPLFQFICLA